jgi:hypothetical protein
MTPDASHSAEIAQDDPIFELRAIREKRAERFGFDIRALYYDAKKREAEEKREVVLREPRRLDPETEDE